MNPLENRSLPDGLWQYVPTWLADLDRALQAQIEGLPLPGASTLHWLTETRDGIATAVVVGLALYLVLHLYSAWRTGARLRGRGWKSTTSGVRRDGLKRVVLLGLLLGLSDLISSGFKLRIGRLKPHVNFYNPNFTPALSLPSNHAFNTAFLCALLWFAVDRGARERWRVAFTALLIVTLVTGFSRVVFGQHYPLDVLAGWAFGAALGAVLAPLYRRFAL